MLFIIDMQNDFVDQIHGKMAVKHADQLVPNIIKKIKEYEEKKDLIFYTKNIHKNMPNDNRSLDVKHWGEEPYGELKDILSPHNYISKLNYGIPPYKSKSMFQNFDDKYMEKIEIIGIETHLCILSNAIILQNTFINSKILIDENLCTSNDLTLHNKALDIMEGLHMEVKRK
ncbi:MAG TPA: isochorismatase family protein [Tissierellaceae bacterium]|nr:isochorismatase family protein [Tissierellaceae bacterium]